MLRACLTFAWRKILLKIVYYWFKSKFPPAELTHITQTFRASEFAVRNEATFCLNFTSTWSQPGLRFLCFKTVWTLVVVFPVSMLCSVTTQTQRAWTCLPLYLVHCLTLSLHTRPQVLQILDCRWWLWSKKVSSVVAVKGRLSQDMQNERSSPCLKICTWWGEGSRRAERQETGIHPCTCIALAQLHLKPDFYQNQENLEISAATHNCANLIQGISGMPTNTVTRPPAALQMCLGRVQEMWNPWKKSGTITFFGVNALGESCCLSALIYLISILWVEMPCFYMKLYEIYQCIYVHKYMYLLMWENWLRSGSLREVRLLQPHARVQAIASWVCISNRHMHKFTYTPSK